MAAAALLNLFITSLTPVLQILLLTAVGAILSVERVNILSPDARKHLNDVVFYVFMPALVGSNLAKFVTLKTLTALWFMPLNVLLTFLVGSALGCAVNRITRTSRDLRGVVLGCCATGNLGNLAFIMIPAVCYGKGTPFGDTDACLGHAMAYATLSMAVGQIFMWSYVYNLMRRYSSRECIEDDDGGHGGTGGIPETEHRNGRSEGKKVVVVREGLGHIWKKLNLGRLLAPTTIGAIVGVVVGVSPPFRKLVIGDEAPFRVLEDTAFMLGQAAIPSLTIIMGANLLKGLKGSKELLPIISGVIGVRYVALPLIGVGVVKAATRLGMVQSEPLFKFVLLLQFALPPAVNIGTMTQLFGGGESECSVIMLFSYVFATASLTLWSMFFMWLVGK